MYKTKWPKMSLREDGRGGCACLYGPRTCGRGGEGVDREIDVIPLLRVRIIMFVFKQLLTVI